MRIFAIPCLSLQRLGQRVPVSPWLPVVITVMVVIAGLHPKDYSWGISPRFDTDIGVNFPPYARLDIVSDPSAGSDNPNVISPFSISLLARFPRPPHGATFMTLVEIPSDSDTSALVLGQWKDQLILMNGHDYRGERPYARVQFSIDALVAKGLSTPIELHIENTAVTLRTSTGTQTVISTHAFNTPGTHGQLIYIGNARDRQHQWRGSLQSLRIDALGIDADFRSLEPALEHPSRREITVNPPECARQDNIRMYCTGSPLSDSRRFLSTDPAYFNNAWRSRIDLALNFLAFLLYSVVLGAWVDRRWTPACRTPALRWITPVALVCWCVLISASMELAQVLIPSRYSSMYDLASNTAGALAGAWVLQCLRRPQLGPAHPSPTT